jgi:hypothetical protein
VCPFAHLPIAGLLLPVCECDHPPMDWPHDAWLSCSANTGTQHNKAGKPAHCKLSGLLTFTALLHIQLAL